MSAEPDIDPALYMKAIRALIQASSTPGGPAVDEAFAITDPMGVPRDWTACLLDGWVDYAKRYRRPLFVSLRTRKNPRFLQSRMFRVRNRCQNRSACRICGLEVQAPARRWHRACLQAYKAESSLGWKEVCKEALELCGWKCEHCECPLYHKRRARKSRKYEFDHILAVALGGRHIIENCQVVCRPCHLEKTKSDMVLIRELRNGK